MSESFHVLVCDDDPLLLELVAFSLRADGHRVTTCGDGMDAILLLAAESVDVLVLDAMMPGYDGSQVLEEIRMNSALAKLPVLMLSARSSEAEVVAALRQGADDYIVKPFIPGELSVRVARLVRQREMKLSAA